MWGCEQAFQRIRAFSKNSYLRSYKVFGIIDTDYRLECGIESYKKDGLYCISVVKVEKLFIVDCVDGFLNKLNIDVLIQEKTNLYINVLNIRSAARTFCCSDVNC